MPELKRLSMNSQLPSLGEFFFSCGLIIWDPGLHWHPERKLMGAVLGFSFVPHSSSMLFPTLFSLLFFIFFFHLFHSVDWEVTE
jgi:hypothetical protein